MSEPAGPVQRAVLVAEGDPAVRRMLAAAFQRWGVTARFAATGAEATDVCRQSDVTIELALLEVALPDMDGPTAFESLRGVCPDLRCWFVGGEGAGYTRQELLANGAEGVLPKPFDLKMLRSVVEPMAAPAPRPMPGAERRVRPHHIKIAI